MKKHILMIYMIILLIRFNIMKINAQETFRIYYLERTLEENLSFSEYVILGDFMNNKKVKLLLETLLYNSEGVINYVPEGSKILGTTLINKDLFVNFNSNVKKYGGINYENNFIRQILHTCFQIEDIKSVTFLIDGKFDILPEGTLVFKYTRKDLDTLEYNQSLHVKNIVYK